MDTRKWYFCLHKVWINSFSNASFHFMKQAFSVTFWEWISFLKSNVRVTNLYLEKRSLPISSRISSPIPSTNPLREKKSLVTLKVGEIFEPHALLFATTGDICKWWIHLDQIPSHASALATVASAMQTCPTCHRLLTYKPPYFGLGYGFFKLNSSARNKRNFIQNKKFNLEDNKVRVKEIATHMLI